MEKKWSATARIDRDGDPIFLAPDGSLWAVSRTLGDVQTIVERLTAGPLIPWSQMEKCGTQDDWIVEVKTLDKETKREEIVNLRR